MKITPRSSPEIQRLPPAYKWEFLRRHPEYIRRWKLANLYWATPQNDPLRHDSDWCLCEEAATLWMPVLTGNLDRCTYPDPSLSAAKLAGGFLLKVAGQENARLSTHRALAEELLNLPQSVQQVIGAILYGANSDGSMADLAKRRQCLALLRDKELDEPPVGFLEFNLHAPLEGILEQVAKLVKEQKAKHSIGQARRRPDVLDDYLQVWDRREGWENGRYEPRGEKKLRDIAVETGTVLETVRDRYQAAYRLVFGEEYHPWRWAFWFRRKIGLSATAGRRKPKTPRVSVAEVPETTLTTEATDDAPGILESQADTTNAQAYESFMNDLKCLFDRGRSNQEIIAELALIHFTEDQLDSLRTRREEGLF
jgi:hypothetical protein